MSHLNHKLFSQVKATITDLKEFEYEGCNTCRKKLNEDRHCPQCADQTTPTIYRYLVLEINENDSIIYASVFNLDIQKGLKELNMEGPMFFEINLKSKTNTNEEIMIPSHVVTRITAISH